jgi:hypothetical protein
MTTPEKIEATKNEVGNQLVSHIQAYCSGMALRELHAELKTRFLFELGMNPAPEPFNTSNCKGHVLGLIRGTTFIEFASLETALRINEASEHFKEAYAIMQPLIDRVAELEAELQAEVETYAEKLHAIRSAEETALEKARLALEKDQNISKLRSQAEAVRPPHIEPPTVFRGRVEIKRESEAVTG